MWYYAGVFRAMERELQNDALHVYVTWDVDRLPRYGADVVAVVLGDEAARTPRYVDRVRAVFKCYGTRPCLDLRPTSPSDLTGFLGLAQTGLRWVRWVPGGLSSGARLLRRRLRDEPAAPVFPIPLGPYNQLALPVTPMGERRTDVFFAGSVEHGTSVRQRVGSPKTRARREMLRAARRLERRHPGLRLDLRVTDGFVTSIESDVVAYSRGLMDARVCLAPRGTSAETFRFYEGLRYGCLVVCERLPSQWFYAGAPVLQLDRWSDLERVLGGALDDPDELTRAQDRSLAWWRERCSEEAVGRYFAERLNRASATATARPAVWDAPCP